MARVLGITRSGVTQAIHTGRMNARHRDGSGQVFITEEEIERYRAEHLGRKGNPILYGPVRHREPPKPAAVRKCRICRESEPEKLIKGKRLCRACNVKLSSEWQKRNRKQRTEYHRQWREAKKKAAS